MRSFGTSLVFFSAVLAALLQNVSCGRGHLHPAPSHPTPEQLANRKRSFSIGMIIFPGWEPLDVFGPMELLFQLSFHYNMTLSVISRDVGPISSIPPPHYMEEGGPIMDMSYLIGPQLTATHTFENAPDLDIIFVPGGQGNVILDQKKDTWVEDFIASRYDQLDYLLSVCTGSVSLARSGVLNGRRATTNKSSFHWVSAVGTNITWVPSARWTVDGNVWTSSGVAAGLDMTYAFLKSVYGADDVDDMMNLIEYAPHTDPHWDPFSIVYDVPGADKNEPLKDCTSPAGYKVDP